MDAAKQANEQFEAYAAAQTAYKSDGTAYNTYVEQKKSASEKDAFSGFFSPPIIPKLVIRPNQPLKPDVYAGIREWDAAK